MNLAVPADAKYKLAISETNLFVADMDNGLTFWMKVNKPEYAEQCGKDFIGFLNSIQYTKAQ